MAIVGWFERARSAIVIELREFRMIHPYTVHITHTQNDETTIINCQINEGFSFHRQLRKKKESLKFINLLLTEKKN